MSNWVLILFRNGFEFVVADADIKMLILSRDKDDGSHSLGSYCFDGAFEKNLDYFGMSKF